MLIGGQKQVHTITIPELSKAEVQIAMPEAEDPRLIKTKRVLEGMPLESYSEEMIRAADYYRIDWKLLPTIAVLESTGGKYSCGGNAWGYSSCNVEFESFDYGIWFVANRLVQSPYSEGDYNYKLCMWVSGHECYGGQALEYLNRGMSLWK